MKKSLIVTVAGTATRFNRDTTEPTLKCLYGIGGTHNTLLYWILDKARDFDEFVIVGGYLYKKLSQYVDENLIGFKNRIKLVYNPEYSSFGSGYSLLLGIQEVDSQVGEIVFVEGDLYFDKEAFIKIVESDKNVFTVNHELITAEKAVVVYENEMHQLRYLYDTKHSYLQITEPFLGIYNSGQVWKFNDIDKLKAVINSLSTDQRKGTNLEIIQKYFGNLPQADLEMVIFDVWNNCNTIKDYEKVYKRIKG